MFAQKETLRFREKQAHGRSSWAEWPLREIKARTLVSKPGIYTSFPGDSSEPVISSSALSIYCRYLAVDWTCLQTLCGRHGERLADWRVSNGTRETDSLDRQVDVDMGGDMLATLSIFAFHLRFGTSSPRPQGTVAIMEAAIFPVPPVSGAPVGPRQVGASFRPVTSLSPRWVPDSSPISHPHFVPLLILQSYRKRHPRWVA
ncbi:hypothetical protein B0T25DRAFT_109844 [Lasiosphaeria hispida]|uniref:Uncharacterized protein n=1 Tax=Lasiosphaeria hispida TaxID=260671 RepID=A0AAJ0HR06_9PEZI|nr:hypothetical protein B0T25DRAFT_109844 [Lasiosphaeria hispida]